MAFRYNAPISKTHEFLVAQWDFERNELSPNQITAGSDKKAWWICSKGHQWEAAISKRGAPCTIF